MSEQYPAGQITQLLKSVADGNSEAQEELWRTVYSELRDIARAQVSKEAQPAAMTPTTLIHEAFLRLSLPEGGSFHNRKYFFTAAANAMRRICVEYARKRNTAKRNKGRGTLSLADEPPFAAQDPVEVLAVDDVLTKLEKFAPRQAKIVELKYFGGFTVKETANALEVSSRTVVDEWRLARVWLYRELGDGNGMPIDSE